MNNPVEGHAALAVSILLDPCLCCLHAFVLDIVGIQIIKDGDVAAACSLKTSLHAIAAHCCVVQSGSTCQVADVCVFGKDLCKQVTLHSAGLGVRRTDECVIKAVCAGCAVAEQDDRNACSVGFLNSGNDACCVAGDNNQNINALGNEGLGLVDLLLGVVVAVCAFDGPALSLSGCLEGIAAAHAENVCVSQVDITDFDGIAAAR